MLIYGNSLRRNQVYHHHRGISRIAVRQLMERIHIVIKKTYCISMLTVGLETKRFDNELKAEIVFCARGKDIERYCYKVVMEIHANSGFVYQV